MTNLGLTWLVTPADVLIYIATFSLGLWVGYKLGKLESR